ncbi:MAG: hypothetical protein FJY20_07485 [Bacteroidetes bacterium]|nr:hypothetical protein [Bacteroidota bacterium]
MKKIICITGLFFCSLVAVAQEEKDCKKVNTSTFRSELNVDGKNIVTMIYRKKDKQIEENTPMGIKMEFNVRWTTPCSYELSDPKVLKGEVPEVSPEQVLYVNILSVSKEAYTAEVSSNFFEGKTIFDFMIVK